MEETTTVSTRLYRFQVEAIEELARKRGVDRSDAIRKLIDEGLKVERIEEALKLIRKNQVTVWKAAEMARVSYREMLKIMETNNVTFPLTVEEIKRELGEIEGNK
jgi:predicted HTH domain antitoxin